MSRVFPKNSRVIAAKIVLGLLLLSLLLVIGIWYYFTPKYTRVGYTPIQPIAFSHEQHVGQLGIDCRYCHTHSDQSAVANIPSTQTCMGCHAADQGGIVHDSPLLGPLRQAHETGRSVDWVRVHKLADFQYFDHSAHVAAGVSCLSCHGQVDQMPVVIHSEPMSMAWCLDCHRNPDPHLRPADQVTNMQWDPATDRTLRGAGMTQRQWAQMIRAHGGITPPLDCTACHR